MPKQLYLPLHDKPPYYANLPTPPSHKYREEPRYDPPDVDLGVPLAGNTGQMSSDEERYEEGDGVETYDHQTPYQDGEQDAKPGPSRKRSRYDDNEEEVNSGRNEQRNGRHNGNDRYTQHHQPRTREIMPSVFGIAPRNEFTKIIGEFIMAYARGRENVEVNREVFPFVDQADMIWLKSD
jgi:polynucleotide 5'-triphosphatase